MFCSHCGKPVPPGTASCPACATRLPRSPDPFSQSVSPSAGKSWVVTLLLALLLPCLGIHRFYTGHYMWGVIQLVTGGGCGVLWLIDLVLILFDGYRAADGQPLVK